MYIRNVNFTLLKNLKPPETLRKFSVWKCNFLCQGFAVERCLTVNNQRNVQIAVFHECKSSQAITVFISFFFRSEVFRGLHAHNLLIT